MKIVSFKTVKYEPEEVKDDQVILKNDANKSKYIVPLIEFKDTGEYLYYLASSVANNSSIENAHIVIVTAGITHYGVYVGPEDVVPE